MDWGPTGLFELLSLIIAPPPETMPPSPHPKMENGGRATG